MAGVIASGELSNPDEREILGRMRVRGAVAVFASVAAIATALNGCEGGRPLGMSGAAGKGD